MSTTPDEQQTPRQAAESRLGAVAITGLTADNETATLFAAAAGIGYALLDIADAIREQTAAVGTAIDNHAGSVDDLKASVDYHGEHR